MSWDDEVYGDRIAGIYDDLYEGRLDTPAAITFLEEQARGATGSGAGRVLELAIGTGRIALPLARKGLDVSGIDISPAMIDKLRAKPGGEDIDVTIGDIADVAVPQVFDLVYVVFNSMFALDTQERQLDLFRNVADHLTDEGVFVIEAWVPDHKRWDRHQTVNIDQIEVDRVAVGFARHDPMLQTVHSQQVFISENGIKMVPVKLRYIWPSEMDLMAKLAGMELRERYGSWTRDHFTSDSKSHVSVYGKA